MRKLLTAEYRKTRGRYLGLTVLGLTAAEVLWLLGGKLKEDAILKGWMMMLYQQPLVNALFLPVLIIIVTTRLGDLEYKNDMLGVLCCMAEKKSLFDAKLIYGGVLVFFSIILQFICMIGFGFFKHFGGRMPVKEYLYLFLFTLTPSLLLYLIQHTLALCCKKPMMPFLVGIIGEFAGVLSMFLPQIPFLRKILPWGHYGELMFVGMDYDKTTRIATYYYMDIGWDMFFVMLFLAVIFYFIGREIFCRREI